jgi:hypothetical protein
MMNMDITSKSAYKLLQQLESDPQLQSIEDTTILNDEQYPTSFESSITNLKDIIPLVSAVTILRWNVDTDSANLNKDQLQRMRVQRQKTARILSLNPTVDNPWDKIKFNFWKDRVTNICLGAAQGAFQSHEDNTNLKFLFSASDRSNTVVHRADQRNVQGLILFHPCLLQAPWEASSSIDADIDKLLQEKVPLIVARSLSNFTGAPLSAHELQLQQTAQQSIDSMRSSLKLLLARIQKFTSHTFHVFLRDLIPGARKGRSLLFTRIVEHRNQYLSGNRSNATAKAYSAKDTLSFIEANYVQDNDNTVHIAWTAILLHTRELLQPLYQWQASFDPLLRKYEQAKTKTLTKTETRKLKCLIAKQVTDDEKVILAGIDPSFTIEGIDKGTYKLRTFQDKLAANASRFQSKKYTPDARILTYLRVRAQDFNVSVPSFMKKRTQEKGKGASQVKRGRSQTQQSRTRTHGVYVGESLVSSTPTTGMPKGNNKGKGRGSPKGKLDNQSSQPSPNVKGKGYGRGKGSFVSKGKGTFKGKLPKGKGYRSPNTGTSLATLVCGFCHLHGHHESNCRKRHALHNSESYQQTRSQFNSRQQLLFDQLENSLFAPNVCSWCLQSGCDVMSCQAPEDTDFYVDTTHHFQETLLPYVQNAKLGLPVDNAAPLMPQHFAFHDADWGQHTDSAFEPSLETWDHSNASDNYESAWEESMDSNADHYILEDVSGEQDEEYVVEQNDSQSICEEHEYNSFVAKLDGTDASDANYDNLEEDEGL